MDLMAQRMTTSHSNGNPRRRDRPRQPPTPWGEGVMWSGDILSDRPGAAYPVKHAESFPAPPRRLSPWDCTYALSDWEGRDGWLSRSFHATAEPG